MKKAFNVEELSYQLSDLPDRATYLAAACACLGTAIGGDQVGWADIDLTGHSMNTWDDPPASAEVREIFTSVAEDVPTVRHYMTHPREFEPCRISGLVTARRWRAHRAYGEWARPLGVRDQLAIVLKRKPQGSSSAWYVNRGAHDFSDADVHIACAVQPVLSVLEIIYQPDDKPQSVEDVREEARQRTGLTPRELDIMTLVANGLTAQQIASLRRISVRTVSKHLQHIYEKLGCHDRLQATNKARSLNLL